MAGAFDVSAAQCISVGGAGVQFGLHGQGDLKRVLGEGVEQQLPDRGVDGAAGDGLAALRTVLDALGDALVVGDFDAAAARTPPSIRQRTSRPSVPRSYAGKWAERAVGDSMAGEGFPLVGGGHR